MVCYCRFVLTTPYRHSHTEKKLCDFRVVFTANSRPKISYCLYRKLFKKVVKAINKPSMSDGYNSPHLYEYRALQHQNLHKFSIAETISFPQAAISRL